MPKYNFNKVAKQLYWNHTSAWVEGCNFIKKEILTQMFSCEICEISKNVFFIEHFWTTASVHLLSIIRLTAVHAVKLSELVNYLQCSILDDSDRICFECAQKISTKQNICWPHYYLKPKATNHMRFEPVKTWNYETKIYFQQCLIKSDSLKAWLKEVESRSATMTKFLAVST